MYLYLMGNKAINYFEACDKYPDFPSLIILKIEMQRRGFIMSKTALDNVNIQIHQTRERTFSRESQGRYPISFILRDGTSVIVRPVVSFKYNLEPFLIDYKNEKFIICFQEIEIDEIFLWERPNYYDKKTSNGIPMWQIANARPQRLDINPCQYCEFWNLHMGCRFCEISSTFNLNKKTMILDLKDIEETVYEALKENGRYTAIFLTGGSLIGENYNFDKEVDLYIKVLQAIGKNFGNFRFPSQLIGTAYSKEQLSRLYRETGLMSYTADLEVLDKDLFRWICPGKNYFVGYETWKQRLYCAVEIFGKGYVSTGIVSGVELAQPNGYKDEICAIEQNLKEAEELCRNGVSVVSCVWRIGKKSLFANQNLPSLDYYINMAKGLHCLRKKYKLYTGLDDYRRCGNHPDTDLDRI